MNCQELEAIVLDRADVPLEGRAHAESCPRCAALVADHRRLDTALRAMAAETAGTQAPAHVESALRGAFRAKAHFEKRRLPRWALAAAAALLVLLGATASWITRPRPQQPRAVPVAQPVIQPQPETAPPMPAKAEALQVAKQVRRVPRIKPKPAAPPAPPQEISTDFLPLEEASTLPPIESAQVVRVRLPRTTLTRFGLPVNPNRLAEPVNADVIFAQDGIARAIRFVR